MTICKHETQQLIRLTQHLSYDIENPEFILVDGILFACFILRHF